jgi:hypothetical protein
MGNFFSKPETDDPNATETDDPNATKVDAKVPAAQYGGDPHVTIDIFGSEKKIAKGS